jgi:PAS domain S-box-containing protein
MSPTRIPATIPNIFGEISFAGTKPRRCKRLTAQEPSTQRPPWRSLLEILGVALLYCLTARLGRLAAPPPGIATVVWPPSGIALAALLILGNRVWPGIWIGAFLSNDWHALPHAGATEGFRFIAAGIGIDTGSLLQALAGAGLIRKFIGKANPFDRFKQSIVFVAIALTMCFISSTAGVASLYLGGMLPRDAIFDRLWTWWVGETGGVLVVTPLALTFHYLGWPKWNRSRWLEALIVLGAGTAFAVLLFVWWRPPLEVRYPADLLLLPLLALVAYRFTQREVALLVAVILGIAVAGTLHGAGPYHGSTPWNSLAVLQAFIGILSMVSIAVGAIITENKAAGDALRSSEHWLRESQRISRIGSYVLDIRTGHWTRSEILDELLGIDSTYSHDRLARFAMVHEEDRQGVIDHLNNDVIGRQRPFQREFRIVRVRDGEIRWVQCNGDLSLDDGGPPGRLAGTLLDITDRKHIEAELLQAKKLESIGRLAGGVAHDFNNLLTVINGYAELLVRRVPSNDPSYTQLQEIRRAGDRAAELTMQLLAFSRKQVLQPKTLNFNDVVRDSDRMLRRVIGEEIDLVCVLDPSLRPVEADPGQLHQVIVNLAINARDAMPLGGTLTIETSNDGSEVCLTVSDTGHGMDHRTLEHVFEPFFTTKGVGKGTGLGLATVYGIVRQSAGRIHVESEPGRGSTFTVRLPVAERPAVPEPAAEPVSMGSGTILLVEDEKGVRQLAAKILEHHGYRVLSAADGQKAIEIYDGYGQAIDLLLCDVIMPRMRGPELATRIRARQPEIKVLFMSGYTDPSIANHAMGAGLRFLQKPFAADTLVRAVNESLRTVHGLDAAPGLGTGSLQANDGGPAGSARPAGIGPG